MRGRTRLGGACTPGHNATPEAGYRTALLSDSPTRVFVIARWIGIAGTTRTRSRTAVLRGPSAARPRSFPPSDASGTVSRNANEGPTAFRPAGPRHQRSSDQASRQRLPHKRGNNNTNNKHNPSRGRNLQSQIVIPLKYRQEFRPLPVRYGYAIQ